MNNDLNNSIHSEESARENLGAGGRLRVENGSSESRDVRGADEMAAQRAHQGVDSLVFRDVVFILAVKNSPAEGVAARDFVRCCTLDVFGHFFEERRISEMLRDCVSIEKV